MFFIWLFQMNDEIAIINFITTIENTNSIPVPESNQEYMCEFIGKRVLITVRKRKVKVPTIEGEKPEDNE